MSRFFGRLPRLVAIKANGGVTITMPGHEFLRSRSITSLSLDNCCFTFNVIFDGLQRDEWDSCDRTIVSLFSTSRTEGLFWILTPCRQLQRLSIKGATFFITLNSDHHIVQEQPSNNAGNAHENGSPASGSSVAA